MNDWPSVQTIADDIKAGKLKAVDLVKLALQKIEDTKDYDAIISTTEKRALERAAEVDKNPSGRLAGVPFIVKDNFLTVGGKTTAASNILRPFEAPYQSTAVQRLEAEGAICVAKANLDAFAHGSSTETLTIKLACQVAVVVVRPRPWL
jgi:aspartyl-tRNA(Asn)/glutamyl-tRNA(Gln) amidotransferase subunit A